MSNAYGHVVHDGKIAGHFEYYGSTDVCSSIFYDTEKEVSDNWRSGRQAVCTCGEPPVDVLLWNDYGGGSYYPSQACFRCHAITGPRDINSVWDAGLDSVDGHPLGPEYETEWAKLCKGET
jgi:hypothetical protein